MEEWKNSLLAILDFFVKGICGSLSYIFGQRNSFLGQNRYIYQTSEVLKQAVYVTAF